MAAGLLGSGRAIELGGRKGASFPLDGGDQLIDLATVQQQFPRPARFVVEAIALEIFGDPWSLLIVRDLLFKGLRTFKEFQGAVSFALRPIQGAVDEVAEGVASVFAALTDIDQLKVPAYISDGLCWLIDQVKRKEADAPKVELVA